MAEVTLTIPRDREFAQIAHLVLGGIALRFDLTFETLEDLQVALAGLLEREEAEGDVTVRLRASEGLIEGSVGPFRSESLRGELERGVDVTGLRRVLETVVDEVELAEREGAQWVDFRKNVSRP